MDLSIVFGTYNRYSLLVDCIESIRQSVGNLHYEIIVVDGGSTDGSRQYLANQPDVVFLGEWELEGAIRAFNKGFSLTKGWATCQLNDDCVCIGSVLSDAYHYLRANQDAVGQIAFYFDTACNGQFRRGDIVNGFVTANLGMCQTLLGHAVGWWGQEDHTYGGDNRLSMEIWQLGYKVVALEQFKVHHIGDHGGPRRPNLDASNFWARWGGREIAIPPVPISREELEGRVIIRPW